MNVKPAIDHHHKRKPRGKPFARGKGVDQRINRVAPGPGLTPDAWREMCRSMVSRQEVREVAEKVLESPDHPAWLGACRWMAESGYGKPDQTINLVSPDVISRLQATIDAVRTLPPEQAEPLLDRLAEVWK